MKPSHSLGSQSGTLSLAVRLRRVHHRNLRVAKYRRRVPELLQGESKPPFFRRRPVLLFCFSGQFFSASSWK